MVTGVAEGSAKNTCIRAAYMMFVGLCKGEPDRLVRMRNGRTVLTIVGGQTAGIFERGTDGVQFVDSVYGFPMHQLVD